jgi:hypothetical protein
VSAGIVVGSYLDQLLDLQRRVELAIEAERRAPSRRPGVRVASEAAPEPPQEPPPTPPAPDVVRVPVRLVRADVVRDWATAHGYDLGRGRIPSMVLEEYAEAHR